MPTAELRQIVLCSLFMLACQPQLRLDAEGSDKRYQLGVDYFSKGMVAPALEELLKAVELNPKNAEARNALGLVFLRKAAEKEELSSRAECLKGEEAKLERDAVDSQFRRAEAEFKQAIELRKDFSEAFNNQAVVELHFGHNEEAVALAERALSNIIYREPYAAHGNLGLAYLNRHTKHDLTLSAQALRQALFEQPQFCVGRYRLAKVYYEQGEFAAAGAELDRVISDKFCPIQEAYHLAGLVALRRLPPDRELAAKLFTQCVALAPKSCLAQECKLVH